MKIHFVGSEGVSMKVLMRIMCFYGHEVSGSDLTLNGHDKKNVENKDLVVYTSAVGEDNIEVVTARALKITTIERAEFLGRVASNYKNVIAVSGSHGKTTVTGFLQQIFLPLNATVHIGGNALGENGHVGEREYFITEACEYKRSFLHIKPDIAIVLNMELDHTDYYVDINDYVSAFSSFCLNSKKALIFDGDHNTGQLKGNIITFGSNINSYYSVQNIVPLKTGYQFDIFRKGAKIFDAKISICGKHNVLNALAAAAAALECGIDKHLIIKGLDEFKGVKRRFELKAECKKAMIYSDYAHHPSEIKTTIDTARTLTKKRVRIVFEPHTFSRTKSLHDGFVKSLAAADEIVLVPIYPARETPLECVTSHNIVLSLLKLGKKAIYIDNFSSAYNYINSTLLPDEVVVFTGAGDIEKLANLFTKKEH